jgi:hypothetical protein
MMAGMAHVESEQGVAPVDGAAPTIQADVGLGEGRSAALGLLILRNVRTGAWVLMSFGVAVAVWFGSLDERSTDRLDTPSGLAASLGTPLALLGVGFALRLAVHPVALLMAAQVVVHNGTDVHSDHDRRPRVLRLWDRFRLASALRSLRWTYAVKAEAVARLGHRGRVLAAVEIVLRVLIGLGITVAVVTLVSSGQADRTGSLPEGPGQVGPASAASTSVAR